MATRSGNPYCPGEGDFIWIDLEPTRGHEQAGRRPALVLSPRAYNSRTQMCIACPTTNQSKNYPFEVTIPTGNKVSGVILADQPRALSWSNRGADFIAQAPKECIEEVREKLATLIGA